jgi:hypothetical protein
VKESPKPTRLWNLDILDFYVEIWAFVDHDTSFACFGNFECLGLVVGHVDFRFRQERCGRKPSREQWEYDIQVASHVPLLDVQAASVAHHLGLRRDP